MANARTTTASRFYVNLLMQEWRMGEASHRIQACVRRVLGELDTEALLILRKEPRLEVMVWSTGYSVWAYFPVYRRRWIAQRCRPKPSTRVLLLFGEERSQEETTAVFEDHLRDHLGHTLLYLRSPRALNNCPAAQREWRRSVRRPPVPPSLARARKAPSRT